MRFRGSREAFWAGGQFVELFYSRLDATVPAVVVHNSNEASKLPTL